MLGNEAWYHFLDEDMRQLADLGMYLLNRERAAEENLVDYSFVVFPMAKAYEGFVKKFLLKSKLISQETYESNHFRIGKSLNPALDTDDRNGEWIYGKLEEACQGTEGAGVAMAMWEAWRLCRNKLFHYFPNYEQQISIETAGERIELLKKAMSLAVSCNIT